ncbi:MAG: hypothetical protein WB760_06420, partial [Xanthobacteraceae bacterium]
MPRRHAQRDGKIVLSVQKFRSDAGGAPKHVDCGTQVTLLGVEHCQQINTFKAFRRLTHETPADLDGVGNAPRPLMIERSLQLSKLVRRCHAAAILSRSAFVVPSQ